MGTQNSRSSFKNNSSIIASTNNYQASEYPVYDSDSFHLTIPNINPSIKMSIF